MLYVHSAAAYTSSRSLQCCLFHTILQASYRVLQNAGDEQGGHGDHANGVQRSGSGLGRNGPKGGRGRPGRGRGQMGMRGDMGMGGPMAPMGAGMMGGMQAMPGQMFVLAPGKPASHTSAVSWCSSTQRAVLHSNRCVLDFVQTFVRRAY